MKYVIVYGESFASTSEAVHEAKLAMNKAVALGYRPISIGGGAAGAEKEPGGKLINVYILMEGPDTAPDILPTGIPAS